MSPPASARVFAYCNPPATGFRLEVDPASNHTAKLLLHLVGPKGVGVLGVAFFLEVNGEGARWAKPQPGLEWFTCGRGWDPGASEPRLARAKVVGDRIQVGLFQRDRPPVLLGTGPILSLALEMNADAPAGTVPLWLPLDKHSAYLDSDRRLQPLMVGVGTLTIEN